MTKNVKKSEMTKATRRIRNRPNKNTQTNVYKTTTDKVGDVLVNQAGVKYKIVGQRYHAPTGYDDGKLKVRILKIEPEKRTGLKPFEMNDRDVKDARDKKIFTRESRKKAKSKPATKKTAVKKAVKKPTKKK